MVDPKSKRLFYQFDPVKGIGTHEHCPIRDIGSIWDIAVLSSFLGRHDLDDHIGKWLHEYIGFLESHRHALRVNPDKLGEPSSIAHSAFMLLSIVVFPHVHVEVHNANHLVKSLADGIVSQQRSDGSYKIHFDDYPDTGQVLYPGEAMLSLLHAFKCTKNKSYLHSVERAFPYYRQYYHRGHVPDDLVVFYSNWMTQAFSMLHTYTEDHGLQGSVRKFIYQLHDGIIESKYYELLRHRPKSYATVEVACGLEGLADAYVLAKTDPSSAGRLELYRISACSAISFLRNVMRKEDPGKGGFGHGLTHHTQRVDVTGHVASAFIKAIEHGIWCEECEGGAAP
jgi:hypothetical protein